MRDWDLECMKDSYNTRLKKEKNSYFLQRMNANGQKSNDHICNIIK